ncbi:MAG: TetR/AcrR family transcriptional regulator [Planctomycetota bacterium]|nr:TetR/AcrR family transcriptional regulator [Planctomycetota bacterium]
MSTRVRKPAATRRREIAEAALDIIGRQGLPALSTATLAASVGLTSGALFRHFDSRAAILDEAVRVGLRKLEATFPEDSLPPLERLRQLALARIQLLSAEPGLAWLLRSEQAFLSLPPDAVERLRSMIRRSRAYLRGALADAQALGAIRSDVDLDVLLLTFTSAVHALIGAPGLQGRAAKSIDPDHALGGIFELLSTRGH